MVANKSYENCSERGFIIKKTIPGLENKNGILLLDSVTSDPPGPGLQALVGERLEPELDAIEGGGLAGVADPPLDVVELQELAFLRLGTLSQSKGE